MVKQVMKEAAGHLTKEILLSTENLMKRPTELMSAVSGNENNRISGHVNKTSDCDLDVW